MIYPVLSKLPVQSFLLDFGLFGPDQSNKSSPIGKKSGLVVHWTSPIGFGLELLDWTGLEKISQFSNFRR